MRYYPFDASLPPKAGWANMHIIAEKFKIFHLIYFIVYVQDGFVK